MADDIRSDEQEQERARPRVVDKRVSSGGSAAPPPATPTAAVPEPQAEAETSLPPSPAPGAGPGSGQVWTPQQEEEARKIAEEIAATPAIEWVVNATVSLANIAATKLDLGQTSDAQIAIDAFAGIMKAVGPQLGNVEQPLRQTLAQLQMAYAERATTPPAPPS
jgi:hypothetical protein